MIIYVQFGFNKVCSFLKISYIHFPIGYSYVTCLFYYSRRLRIPITTKYFKMKMFVKDHPEIIQVQVRFKSSLQFLRKILDLFSHRVVF
jgi:hypothetical protein